MLHEVCKKIDSYCKENNKRMIMIAVETNEEGDPENIVFHRVSNPMIASGMLNVIEHLVTTQKEELVDYTFNNGVRSESNSTNDLDKQLEALDLLNRFKNLKEQGDKAKDESPEKLLEIMIEMKEISEKLKSFMKDNSDGKDSDNSNKSNGLSDDIKNMF
jgi:hypothetical protein